MSETKQKHIMTYSRVGGNYQLLIRSFDDLPFILGNVDRLCAVVIRLSSNLFGCNDSRLTVFL